MSNYLKPFAYLHTHSQQSLQDGVPTIKEHLRWCLQNGIPSISMTEHGNASSFYDIVRFPQLIKEINKEEKTDYPLDACVGIPGVELYVKLAPEDKKHYHICCWATSNEGYFNLMKLSSIAFKDTVSFFGSVKARVTFQQIMQYRAGIKIGTACMGSPMGSALLRGEVDLAEKLFQAYVSAFGDDLYVELHASSQTHQHNRKTGQFDPNPPLADGTTDYYQAYNRFMLRMARKHGGKVVPVTDAHFLSPDDKILQDIMLMAGSSTGWRFHECFEKDTGVDMWDGSRKAISLIQPGDYVKTYDFKSGRVVPGKVVRSFCSPASPGEFMANRFYGSGLPVGGKEAVVSTRNHEFFNGKDWQKVESLQTACVSAAVVSDVVRDTIAGAMLGDGSITAVRNTTQFAYGHAEDQQQLTNHIAALLGCKVGRLRKAGGYGKQRQSRLVWSHPFVSQEFNRWYHDGQKRIPSDLVLSPRVLAQWYMDDGSLTLSTTRKAGKKKRKTACVRGRFHTCGFSDKDNGVLVKKLKQLGISVTFCKYDKNRGFLAFGKKAAIKLHSIIAEHVVPDLQYKLLPEFRNKFKAISAESDVQQTIYNVLSRKEVKIPARKDLTHKWDIEVEGHHCFFVGGILAHNSCHQKRPEEIYRILKAQLGDEMTEADFEQWGRNANEVGDAARSIKVDFDYHLPKIDVPAEIQETTQDYGQQLKDTLMMRIRGHGRWREEPEYVERFYRELDVIADNEKLNFIPYFLVYEDLCKYARSQGELQNIARGSAGGCLISYYLKIIHIDPVEHKLPFERFLSHARIRAGSFPDIDCDFQDRKTVVKYLMDKYGLGFAQVATYTKMKVKNAIKDSMWATYGRMRNDPEVEAVCKTIEDSPQGVDERDFLYGYTDQEDNYHIGEIERNAVLADFFQRYPEVEKLVERLIGIIRGTSRHASAFVISSLDLAATRVPIMYMQDDEIGMIPVTQYDAKMVEKSGLVKADILKIMTLQAVAEAIRLIKDRHGVDLMTEDSRGIAHIYRLPDDQSVYGDFCRAKTDSSFQFNSDLIKKYLPDFMPTSRENLSDLTALCRPGSLDAPFWDTTAAQYYVQVRRGTRPMEFLHPDLEPILGSTNACIVYQEQLMRFLVEIVGYTWEESDVIRSAIAKKKQEVIMAAFDRVRTSTKARGWTEEQTEMICQQILAFSRYSFNQSHSRAYAELGYITMWLKKNYILEWWTGVLNSKIGKEVDLRKFVSLLGPIVKPPSLAHASDQFHIVGDSIISPLSIIKKVGNAASRELMAKKPFASFDDFMDRVDHRQCNTGAFGALVKGRAADCFMDLSRPYGEARIDLLNRYKLTRKKLKKSFTGKFDEELYKVDPISVYMQERGSNQAFNKVLLQDTTIQGEIASMWPGLKSTGRAEIPFTIADVPVLSSVKLAAGLHENGHQGEVGMILLFHESAIKKGVSSKTGRPYMFLTAALSDGVDPIECVQWDVGVPWRLLEGTIVFVRGMLKPGFRSSVAMSINEVLPIEKVTIEGDQNG